MHLRRSSAQPHRQAREPFKRVIRTSSAKGSAHAVEYGRGSRIRTCDPLLPKQMRYRAALYPEWPLSPPQSGYHAAASCRKQDGSQRLNSGCSTLSPGLMPSLAAVPPLTSSTESTGSPEGIVRVESGSVFSAMRATVPSARMNSMSSGI